VRTGYVAAGGIRLHYEDRGSGTPVLLLHGFSGSAQVMRGVAGRLAGRHRVVSLDLIGHGRSEKSDVDSYTFEEALDLVGTAAQSLKLEPCHLAGYSMGGRIALALAAEGDLRLRSVVSISASPGIASGEERAARRRADEKLAEDIERHGVEWFESHWSSQELLRPRTAAGREAAADVSRVRRANDAGALAAALRAMGPGSMPYLGERLVDLGIPALLLAGSEDERYCAIAAELARRIPDGREVIIPGAGHAVPTDAPGPVADAMLDFFAEVEARAAA
jgi:2-succinyl-6-hydroxy-2,4-cyclohexadiene-1-carboxylate synthase